MSGRVGGRWRRGLWLAIALLWPTAMAPAQRGGPGSAPRIRKARPTVQGSLSVDVVQRLLRRHSPELMSCYDQALRTEPTLEGKLTLRLVIGATGSVDHTEARRVQGIGEELTACILGRARTWAFPSSGDGLVIVDWPMVLTPPWNAAPRGYGG